MPSTGAWRACLSSVNISGSTSNLENARRVAKAGPISLAVIACPNRPEPEEISLAKILTGAGQQ